MSNLEVAPSLTHAGTRGVAARPVHQVFAGREVTLGETTGVRRLLPNLHRRLVGAWCFVDHYGPQDISDAAGMAVPPHPHIGLQTVSWLLEGEVHHRDSLGNSQQIRPGQLGLMTAGRGIAHAEHSPVPRPALLHGVQLWVALPAAASQVAPGWQHHSVLPVLEADGLRATVMLGSLAGASSPGATYSAIAGASLDLTAGAAAQVPLEPDFEYAALVMSGAAQVDGVDLAIGSMLYLGCGRSSLPVSSESGARALLLGGEPFADHIVMWWNFVGHSADEVVEARRDWQDGRRFGTVRDAGTRLEAPPLPSGARLKPGGATRS